MQTTATSASPPSGHASRANPLGSTAAESTLSVRRINVMRVGYAVMGVGIAVRNWPLLVNRSEPWPLY
jgi:hypothetical protein